MMGASGSSAADGEVPGDAGVARELAADGAAAAGPSAANGPSPSSDGAVEAGASVGAEAAEATSTTGPSALEPPVAAQEAAESSAAPSVSGPEAAAAAGAEEAAAEAAAAVPAEGSDAAEGAAPAAAPEPATGAEEAVHTVNVVLPEGFMGIPIDMIMDEQVQARIYDTCRRTVGADAFRRMWPGGRRELLEAMRNGLEDRGRGPVAHAMTRAAADTLVARFQSSELVAAEVVVDRDAAARVVARASGVRSQGGGPPPSESDRVHSVYFVLRADMLFMLDFVLPDVLGRILRHQEFALSWPEGPPAMEAALRQGVEEFGRGPLLHGMRLPQAESLRDQLAEFIEAEVVVDRQAAAKVQERRRRSQPPPRPPPNEILSKFSPGARVRIAAEPKEEIERAQTGFGGWTEMLEGCLGKEGLVVAYSPAEGERSWSIRVACVEGDRIHHEWNPTNLTAVAHPPAAGEGSAKQDIPFGAQVLFVGPESSQEELGLQRRHPGLVQRADEDGTYRVLFASATSTCSVPAGSLQFTQPASSESKSSFEVLLISDEELRVGDSVVFHIDGTWRVGRVASAAGGDDYDVQGADGFVEERVPKQHIQMVEVIDSSAKQIASGSIVRITGDKELAQECQRSNWKDDLEACLGQLGKVVEVKDRRRLVVRCPAASSPQSWSSSCLTVESTEGLLCLDLHARPLWWCERLASPQKCAACEKGDFREAYTCLESGSCSLCSTCAAPYLEKSKAEKRSSPHHLGLLRAIALPRGTKESRWPCAGELFPGGCRSAPSFALKKAGEAAEDGKEHVGSFGGSCCSSCHVMLCDACIGDETLGESTAHTRKADVAALPHSSLRLIALLQAHPSEAFALEQEGLMAALANCVATNAAARELALDLGTWLASEPTEVAFAGPTLLERDDGKWAEVHVMSEDVCSFDGIWTEQADPGKWVRKVEGKKIGPREIGPDPGVQIAIEVSGCGLPEFNGWFVQEGTKNDRPKFRKAGGGPQTCNFWRGTWFLCHDFTSSWYQVESDAERPPASGWKVGKKGKAPAPSIVHARQAPLVECYRKERFTLLPSVGSWAAPVPAALLSEEEEEEGPQRGEAQPEAQPEEPPPAADQPPAAAPAQAQAQAPAPQQQQQQQQQQAQAPRAVAARAQAATGSSGEKGGKEEQPSAVTLERLGRGAFSAEFDGSRRCARLTLDGRLEWSDAQPTWVLLERCPRCPINHMLRPSRHTVPWTCGICGESSSENSRLRCAICEFDVCDNCVAARDWELDATPGASASASSSSSPPDPAAAEPAGASSAAVTGATASVGALVLRPGSQASVFLASRGAGVRTWSNCRVLGPGDRSGTTRVVLLQSDGSDGEERTLADWRLREPVSSPAASPTADGPGQEPFPEQGLIDALWLCTTPDGQSVGIRAAPEIEGPTEGHVQDGTLFRVCEHRQGEAGVNFLRLTDERGWVPDSKPDVGLLCAMLRCREARSCMLPRCTVAWSGAADEPEAAEASAAEAAAASAGYLHDVPVTRLHAPFPNSPGDGGTDCWLRADVLQLLRKGSGCNCADLQEVLEKRPNLLSYGYDSGEDVMSVAMQAKVSGEVMETLLAAGVPAGTGHGATPSFKEVLSRGYPRLLMLLSEAGGGVAREAAAVLRSSLEEGATTVPACAAEATEEEKEQWRGLVGRCAEMSDRMAIPRPRGCFSELLHGFGEELLVPLIPLAEDGTLDPNGWLGAVLAALISVNYRFSKRQLRHLATMIASKSVERPNDDPQDALRFIRFLFHALDAGGGQEESVQTLCSELTRHGIADWVYRLANPDSETPPCKALHGRVFRIGDQVRVKPGVEPRTGWGSITSASIGTISSFDVGSPDKFKVDFPEQTGWVAHKDDMEKVSMDYSKPRAVASSLVKRLPSAKDAGAGLKNDELEAIAKALPDGKAFRKLVNMLRKGSCTAFELSLYDLPSKILAMCEAHDQPWPWTIAKPPMDLMSMCMLATKLQVLLGMTETFPLTPLGMRNDGLDSLLKPHKLVLEGLGPGKACSRRRELHVEPLLTLSDLERFLLQTTPVEDAGYLEWCEALRNGRIAERPNSSAPWRAAAVLGFRIDSGVPVHSLRYEDTGEEAQVVLHLRRVVVLQGRKLSQDETEAKACVGWKGLGSKVLLYQVGSRVQACFKDGSWCRAKIEKENGDGTFTVKWENGTQSDVIKKEWELQPLKGKAICQMVKVTLDSNTLAGVALWENASGALDIVDQDGRFLTNISSESIVNEARHARDSSGRPVPFEIRSLPLPDRAVPQAPALERSFSALDRNRPQLGAIPFRRIGGPKGEPLHAPEEESPSHLVFQGEVLAGAPAPRLKVSFFRSPPGPSDSGGGSSPPDGGGGGGSSSSSSSSPSVAATAAAAAAEAAAAAASKGPENDEEGSGVNGSSAEDGQEKRANDAADRDGSEPLPLTSTVLQAFLGSSESAAGVRKAMASQRGPTYSRFGGNWPGRAPIPEMPRLSYRMSVEEEAELVSPRSPSSPSAPSRSSRFLRAARQGADAVEDGAAAAGLAQTDDAGPASAIVAPVLALLRRLREHIGAETEAMKEESTSKEKRDDAEEGSKDGEQQAKQQQQQQQKGGDSKPRQPLPYAQRLRLFGEHLQDGDQEDPDETEWLLDPNWPCVVRWENTSLNGKLADLLAHPLLTAATVMPAWSISLPRAYPFFFQRRVREQLLRCAGFGTSHAVLWLQQQSIQARYGDQLRRAEGRERRMEVTDKILADGRVFIGPARSDFVTLPSRQDVLGSAQRVVEMTHDSKAVLEVKFGDEGGFGDGVTQSFYTAVAAELVETATEGGSSCGNLGLWAEHLPDHVKVSNGRGYLHSRRGLFPRPYAPGTADSERVCRQFHFLGRLMVKALRDNFVVPLPICIHFFSAVLGDDLSLEALPGADDGWSGGFMRAAAKFASDLRRQHGALAPEARAAAFREEADKPDWGSRYLSHEKGEQTSWSFNKYVETCCITFTEYGSGGRELCEDGADRPLTIDGLESFVELAASWWLREGIAPQVAAFRQGVEDICSSFAIWAFEPPELRSLFCGAQVTWTKSELQRHLRTRVGVDAKTMEMLVEVLDKMDLDRRAKFLDFVTACPRLPPGGLPAAEIDVVASQPPGGLPRARTCVNELHLPSYSSVDQLQEQLDRAIDNADGLFDDNRMGWAA